MYRAQWDHRAVPRYWKRWSCATWSRRRRRATRQSPRVNNGRFGHIRALWACPAIPGRASFLHHNHHSSQSHYAGHCRGTWRKERRRPGRRRLSRRAAPSRPNGTPHLLTRVNPFYAFEQLYRPFRAGP